MTQSESIGELAAALSKAQAEMTGVEKNATNPFHKNSYAKLDAVCAASRIISKYNMCLTQTVQLVNNTFVLETMLIHSSGQWKCGHYPLNPIKNDPSGFAGAVTFARRNSELAILNMAPEEDDDGNAASNRAENKQPEKKQPEYQNDSYQNEGSHPSVAQLNRLYAMVKEANWNNEEVRLKIEKDYNKKSAKDLTIIEYNKLTDHLLRNKKPA